VLFSVPLPSNVTALDRLSPRPTLRPARHSRPPFDPSPDPQRWSWLLPQPATFTISFHAGSSRRPANIPLHNLSSSSRPREGDSAYLLDNDKDSARSSFDTPSSHSDDLSLWSDTGDLVDQLADQEDPLAIRLESQLPSQRRHKKHARFASQDSLNEKGHRELRLEDIAIPDPGPRTISKAEKILARIMAPNDGPSRIHGLHGKKLMYAELHSRWHRQY
jgi:hypothetical protein